MPDTENKAAFALRARNLLSEPPSRSRRRAHEKVSVAHNNRKALPGATEDVLLDHLNKPIAHFCDNAHMPVLRVGKHQQVVRTRWLARSVAILDKPAPLVECAIWNGLVEEAFGMTHYIGHFVSFDIVIKPFDELHALPFLAVVIPVWCVVPPVAPKEQQAVVIYRHTPIAVEHSAYSSCVVKKQKRHCHTA